MSLKLKKLFSWLGPYPYNPLIIFAFFTTTYFSRFVHGIGEQPAGPARWVAGITILIVAAFPGGIFAVIALLFNKYRPWPLNRFTYILEIAIGQALLLMVFPLMSQVLESQLGLKHSATAALTPSLFIGSLILVLGIFAAMHHGERVVLDRLKLADSLVSKLEIDRQILLRADEELRQQTARFLHDRVQSDLMVAGIKLRNASAHTSFEVSEVINRVVAILENTRSIDLKNLTQILAPNFEASGIEHALNELVVAYRTEMDIFVSVDEASENLTNVTKLGIFRIAEQALLNSLVHGPAKTVRISLVTNGVGVATLTVSDDGPGGAFESAKPGAGTAVIDSWVSTLMAKKTVETVPGHGYQLTIEIPHASELADLPLVTNRTT